MNKDDLEKYKLQLEINKLKISWYKNIEFWKFIIPTFTILASLYFTFGKGILDNEKKILELKKETLKLDISRFQSTKNSIEIDIVEKDSIRIELELKIKNYLNQQKALSNKISKINKDLDLKKSENISIKSEKAKDKSFYLRKLLERKKKEKDFSDKLNSYKIKINSQKVTEAILRTELKFYQSKIKLDNLEINELNILKSSASIDALSKQTRTVEQIKESINVKYEKEKERIENLSVDELVREWELMARELELK